MIKTTSEIYEENCDCDGVINEDKQWIEVEKVKEAIEETNNYMMDLFHDDSIRSSVIFVITDNIKERLGWGV